MVASTVRFFWQKPVECNARWTLYSAQTSLERGDMIAAGCKLREALRSYLHAECEYAACLPKGRRRHLSRQYSPRTLANALRKAGHLEDGCYAWAVEMIEIGNKAAHLTFVRPQEIATAINLLHSFLDSSPYLVQSKSNR